MPTVDLAQLAERLRNARKAAALSQEEVAAKTGILQPSISAIESGKRNVDSLELAKFGELYKKPVTYFLDPHSIEDKGSFAPVLKSLEILDSDRPILDDFRIFCEDYAELEQLILKKVNIVRVFEDAPRVSSSNEAREQGNRYALELRNLFGVGIEPVYDVRLFLDSIGIKAIKRKLSTKDVSGIYVFSPEYGHCILVNRSGNRQLDRFSLAHTFCHALLDWQGMKAAENYIVCRNWEKDSLKEYRANVFAMALLMPSDTIQKLWLQMRTQEKPTIFDTIAIARYFGIDYESALYRIALLGLISEKERATMWKMLSLSGTELDDLLGYKTSEVRISGEEMYSDRYIKFAFEAYRQGKISEGRLAKYLGKTIYETTNLIQKMRISNIIPTKIAE